MKIRPNDSSSVAGTPVPGRCSLTEWDVRFSTASFRRLGEQMVLRWQFRVDPEEQRAPEPRHPGIAHARRVAGFFRPRSAIRRRTSLRTRVAGSGFEAEKRIVPLLVS